MFSLIELYESSPFVIALSNSEEEIKTLSDRYMEEGNHKLTLKIEKSKIYKIEVVNFSVKEDINFNIVDKLPSNFNPASFVIKIGDIKVRFTLTDKEFDVRQKYCAFGLLFKNNGKFYTAEKLAFCDDEILISKLENFSKFNSQIPEDCPSNKTLLFYRISPKLNEIFYDGLMNQN